MQATGQTNSTDQAVLDKNGTEGEAQKPALSSLITIALPQKLNSMQGKPLNSLPPKKGKERIKSREKVLKQASIDAT